MIGGEFERIPEAFLVTYRAELLRWARDLERIGPQLTIDLLKPAGQSVLHVEGVQPRVTLMCEIWKRGGEAKLLVKPATEFDAELIDRHCRELPKLRVIANDNLPRPKARKHVDAVFDRIPDEFVQEYSLELTSWGSDFARRGPNATIVLRDIPSMPVALDAHGQRPMLGVVLSAKVDRARKGDDFVRLIISPETEDDRRKIVRHVADIAKFGRPVPPVGRPKDRATMEVTGVQ